MNARHHVPEAAFRASTSWSKQLTTPAFLGEDVAVISGYKSFICERMKTKNTTRTCYYFRK